MSFRLTRAVIVIFILFLFVNGESRAQTPLPNGQLTTRGDVVTFAWSPRGDFLLVARAGATSQISPTRAQQVTDLYQLDLQTRVETLLARNANLPALDPNGERVAYLSFRGDGSAALNVRDLASGTVREVGEADPFAPPRWSSDGRAIFFSRQGRTLGVAQDTGAIQQAFATRVTVSPDATRAVYAAPDGLHLIEGNQDRVVFPIRAGEAVGNQPAWSHDSSQVAFVVDRASLTPDLWAISRDGVGGRQLARGAMEFISDLEWSPRDDTLLFIRTPTGSNVASQAEIWRANVAANTLTRLTFNDVEESQARYSRDGNSLAFIRDGNVFVEPISVFRVPTSVLPSPSSEIPPAPALPNVTPVATAQLTPPVSIRVIHSASNTCRPGVSVGQIDTVTFETYVKYVTPTEMPALWGFEAVKTQAVSARTYGWYEILQHPPPTYTYDVSDWTDYQAMCPSKAYTTSNQAVDATRGQYIAYTGQIILAQYGANNSDPTTTFTGVPYLLAVDDPVDFGDALSGHGHGMSQWGAKRWAENYVWNYQQILLHYYSNATVEAPFAPSPDITAPIGSLIVPWNNRGVNSNHALLVANASDNSSKVAGLDFVATYTNGVTATLAHLTNAPWQYVWDESALANQNPITVSVRITDAAGNKFTGNPTIFALDRVLPTGSLTTPATTTAPTMTLNLNASDAGTSGLTRMGFSNNWIWEGENQQVDYPGGQPSGSVVSDTGALNGFALRGHLGTNPAGYWFGPYTTIIPVGQEYRAYFRLKTDNVLTTTEVAMLDVVKDAGATHLGLKRLRGTDFRAANQYQEFYVDFYFNQSCASFCLEFRTAYRATANLWLDRILVVSYPEIYAPTKQWTVPNGYGSKRVIAKFSDGAENISADANAIVMFLAQTFIPALFANAP